MKIYQVWESSDAAQTDSFFPTKSEAMERLRSSYDVEGPGNADDIMPDCLYWETEDGVVYLQTHWIKPTRAGIAQALTTLPNR